MNPADLAGMLEMMAQALRMLPAGEWKRVGMQAASAA